MEKTRKRYLIIVIVDILICTAILLGTSYLQSSKVISHRLEEETQLQADAYAQELGGWMNGYASVIDSIAMQLGQDRVVDRSETAIREYLRSNLTNINSAGEIADLYYTDVNNHMICGGDFTDPGTVDYVHDREWFVKAARGDSLCYSRPYMDAIEDRVVITLSRAVRTGSTLRGVFCADIYLDTLVDKIGNADVIADGYAFLLDSAYDMIVHPNPDFQFDEEPKSMLSLKTVDYSILKTHIESDKRDIHYIVDYDGEERGFTTSVIPGMNWYVGIATPKSMLTKDIRSLSYVFIVAGLASVVIGAIVLIFFTSRMIRSRQVSASTALRRFGLKKSLSAVAAVIFFVSLILVYVTMLYNSSKERIMAQGELHSVESANSLNRYISQGTTIVRQTQYNLDKQLSDGCTEQDIRDYMVSNTDSIQHTVDKNYTGLYGYINGRYYDGANWVPDDGWVATERPWYKKAVAANGKIVLVEPYIDSQTGLMTMTVAVAMNDRKNVVAIDVAFSMMKTVTEETVTSMDQIEMVLDSKGSVIAHSNEQEIGKNYLEEKDTLGAVVAEKLYGEYEQCFELTYDGVDYVVYCVNMNNEWYSLTLIDSKESYQPLRILVIATVFIVVITVAILVLIFYNISSKNLAVEKLNVQLSATSDIYVTAHDIDLIHDTFSEIHVSPKLHEYLDNAGSSARETLYQVTGLATMEDTRNNILEFVDLDTLEERMGGKKTMAMEFHAKDGRWMRGRFIVSERKPDGKIAHVLWLVESVDEEKKVRDNLQDISSRAIAESEAKSAFLSNMSHEIRTPITAVLGMNEMVLRECTDPNIINYAESIETAGRTLLGLVNDILDFSKIEAGKMEILPVEYDLSSVLNDLVNMTQIRVEEKGLILKLDFNPDMPNMLFGDEVRIKQIVTNILTNAVKYTERGRVTFSMTYKKLPQQSDQILMIVEVKDTGIGIKQEDMDKLFSRFDRIEEQRNRNIEGTGLGMTITKRLIDMMDGVMEVESEYGLGSTFRVTLKQKVVEWTPIGNYEEAFRRHVEERDRYHQIFTAPEARILVVDDTRMNLMVFKSLLKSTQVQIDTAESGIEGLALMRKNAYDVIFLDHMMPGKDGIQTLHELREEENGPNIDKPVICLTANAISGAREMYMKEGFDNYLTKPIDSAKLEETLVSYLPEDKVRFEVEDTIADMEPDEEPGLTPVLPRKEPVMTESPLMQPHEGFDLAGAIDGMGSEEAFRPILDIFYETIDENVEEIESLYESENWEDYTIQVHALKSSARIVGALEFGEEAFAMEMAGKDRNLEYIQEHHEELIAHYRHLGEVLSDIYEDAEEMPAGDKKEASPLSIIGWYERIRAGAEDMDIDMLDAVFEEIQEYELPSEDEDRMKELKHLAESFEYDTITDMLG